MNIKNKLSKFDFIDGSFTSLKLLEYHRDIEIKLYDKFDRQKLKMILKGVVSMNYLSKIKQESFNIKDEYIEDVQPNPLEAYYWGIKSFGINNVVLKEDSPDVIELQKDYNFKLYKLIFDVNNCNINFIFHDLEIEEI